MLLLETPVQKAGVCYSLPVSPDNLQIQSNLGSATPPITNNSVYEQIFRTQNVSDDVLCLELRTRKPSKRRPKTNHTGQLFSETEAQWV